MVLKQPCLEVIGVYRLNVTKKLVDEQYHNLYPQMKSPADKRRAISWCKQQLASVVLIEVLVKNPDERFQVCDFTQEQEGLSRDRWQAAYRVAFLTASGDRRLTKPARGEVAGSSFRCAFFLHSYRPEKQLMTSYGAFNCPPVKDMPERLEELVQFVPVD
jgi:hypothetical protein